MKMKLSDFKGLFKKSMLTIESVRNTYGDYYEIKLKPEAGVSWSPGEHGIFRLPNNKVEGKKWRGFSVASVPEEGVMTIGTRTGKEISSFKKELISMKKGDQVSIRGPFGWFRIQDSITPMVMVAGGVGITPIRALLKQMENDLSRPVELVYISSDYYLFEDEIQAIVSSNEKITLYKISKREETSAALAKLTTKYESNAFYYVSGSQPFIGAIKKQITAKGVKKNRIINDPFLGY
jgi:ferredoxin-NADP reductase